MKYECLILDHDDTIVNSTESVNYISFTHVLKKLRPDVNITLDEFFKLNFDLGFLPMCYDVFNFSKDEMNYQVEYWQDYISRHSPQIFEGVKELLWDFVNSGGKIFVVSHSMSREIIRHYKEHGLPCPEHVYGWEYEEIKRKPSTWPVEDIIKKYGFKKEEILMVDDLKPGKIMADNSGISFAAAGWAHNIPEIVNYMRHESKIYCSSVFELREILF